MNEVYFSNDIFLSNYTKYAHGIVHDKIDQSDDNFKTLNKLFEYDETHSEIFENLIYRKYKKKYNAESESFSKLTQIPHIRLTNFDLLLGTLLKRSLQARICFNDVQSLQITYQEGLPKFAKSQQN